jgi:hypothetical protein
LPKAGCDPAPNFGERVKWDPAVDPRLSLERNSARKLRRHSQLFFDPKKLIVLRDAVCAAGRSGLDYISDITIRAILFRPLDLWRRSMAQLELDRIPV